MSRYTHVFLASVAAATLLGGCVTYSQSRLAAMSTTDICEAQDVQGPNLTPESRRAMQDELQRRKTDCRSVAAEVALRREDALHELVYGSPDDP